MKNISPMTQILFNKLFGNLEDRYNTWIHNILKNKAQYSASDITYMSWTFLQVLYFTAILSLDFLHFSPSVDFNLTLSFNFTTSSLNSTETSSLQLYAFFTLASLPIVKFYSTLPVMRAVKCMWLIFTVSLSVIFLISFA